MATIPRRIYDTCEDMLYQRESLVKAASERLMSARERAYAAHGQNLDTSCVASSGDKSGPVERAVFAILQAEADLCAALKWAEVFHTLTTFLQESQKRKLPMQSMCGTSSKKTLPK